MRTNTSEPTINAIAPWFGSNRMLAERVGELLEGCPWVGIPFAGSMAEVKHITARTIVVNDIHRNVINLARTLAHPTAGPYLYRHLRRAIFHPDELADAQEWCKTYPPIKHDCDIEAAYRYFIAVWMGRSANAGTDGEFRGGLALRWNAGGGDSAKRFQSAVASLPAWRRLMRRCTFTTLDFRDFLRSCKDKEKTGIYVDSPFPKAGDKYKHKFTKQDHHDLALMLANDFSSARIVCRFYDHPLVRELYPADRWEWLIQEGGRKQSNADAPEVLLVSRR